MKKHHRWLISLFVAVVIAAWLLLFGLPPSLVLSVADLASYDLLLNAKGFAGPAVGIAAAEPDVMKAFRALASHDGGGAAFKYLLLRGSTAGKLYALAGLQRTNPVFFRIAVQPFRLWPAEVDTIFGCVGESVPVRELVETNRPNPVRLKPGETLAQWWRERTPGTQANLDILGGGYTSMFLDWAELIRPAS